MKEHKGMRPQDVVILLKIVSLDEDDWFNKDLAHQLGISNSEISESLNRSVIAGLIQSDKKSVFKERLIEFLVYGIKYVFPVHPGRMVRGIPTAHSADILKGDFVHEDLFVWPASRGAKRGSKIEPLYHTVPEACGEDRDLYNLLAITDAIRIGNPEDREVLADKLIRLFYRMEKS